MTNINGEKIQRLKVSETRLCRLIQDTSTNYDFQI